MKRALVNGVELAFVDRGQGTPVVLVHGFPLDHTMWNPQIDALSKSCRVIVPDLRGFGQSGLDEKQLTMEQFADDLAGLLDTLAVGGQIVLGGLSMGGYIAFQFWRRHGARLAGLILCDTRATNDSPQMAAGRKEMAERVLREGPSPLVETMFPKLFAPASADQCPEVVAALREVMMRTNPRAMAAAALGMAQRPDVTGWLVEIDCPTLVIVGQRDVISPPAEMRAWAKAIARARYVEIPDCGHMSTLEQPAKVNAAILDFLGTIPAAAS